MTWTDADTLASLARTDAACEGQLYPEEKMDAREKIATFARGHTGCSAHVNQAKYIEAVVPKADRVPERLGYYIGPKPPSTCGLFADECLAGAGIDHPPIEGHYVAGTVIARLEAVDGGRALRLGTPDRPIWKGDIAIIDDGSGRDAHVMVMTSEARLDYTGSGAYWVDTAEGGQLPDSSGVEAFEGEHARRFELRDGKLWCGHRYVVAWLDADAFVIGDDVAPDAGDGARAADTLPPSSPPTEPPPDPDVTIKP